LEISVLSESHLTEINEEEISMICIFSLKLSVLRLVELSLKGIKFTWSNMQQNPLLKRLDWFFDFILLERFLSILICLSFGQAYIWSCPFRHCNWNQKQKASLFIFENYCLHHSGFKQIVETSWNIHVGFTDSAKKKRETQESEKKC
jgi:hypothetical protein